jgi:hypothetical protein
MSFRCSLLAPLSLLLLLAGCPASEAPSSPVASIDAAATDGRAAAAAPSTPAEEPGQDADSSDAGPAREEQARPPLDSGDDPDPAEASPRPTEQPVEAEAPAQLAKRKQLDMSDLMRGAAVIDVDPTIGTPSKRNPEPAARPAPVAGDAAPASRTNGGTGSQPHVDEGKGRRASARGSSSQGPERSQAAPRRVVARRPSLKAQEQGAHVALRYVEVWQRVHKVRHGHYAESFDDMEDQSRLKAASAYSYELRTRGEVWRCVATPLQPGLLHFAADVGTKVTRIVSSSERISCIPGSPLPSDTAVHAQKSTLR